MKIVLFGEIMLRLNPPGYQRLSQASSLCYNIGGAEGNVAVEIAYMGGQSVFVTKLPEHEVGESVVGILRKYGVDTSEIVRGGERVGIYFLENGVAQRATKVIYDRKHSAIADADPSDFDWRRIFSGAGWFHFSGITAMISDSAAHCCLDACRTAKEMGLTVSCDPNYRKKLWIPGKTDKIVCELMEYVDVCVLNEEDAEMALGAKADRTLGEGETYKNLACSLASRYGFKKVALMLYKNPAAVERDWMDLLYDAEKDEYYFSPQYRVYLVDRVGAGDSFCGALIFALSEGMDCGRAVDYAAAASALKHTVEGDFNLVSRAETEALIASSKK